MQASQPPSQSFRVQKSCSPFSSHYISIGKVTASRAQWQIKNEVFQFGIAEVLRRNIALADTLIRLTSDRRDEGVALKNDITRYELMRSQMEVKLTAVANGISIIEREMLTAAGVTDRSSLKNTETRAYHANASICPPHYLIKLLGVSRTCRNRSSSCRLQRGMSRGMREPP